MPSPRTTHAHTHKVQCKISTGLQHHGSHGPSAARLGLYDLGSAEEDVSSVILHTVGFPGHRVVRVGQCCFSDGNAFA